MPKVVRFRPNVRSCRVGSIGLIVGLSPSPSYRHKKLVGKKKKQNGKKIFAFDKFFG